MANRYSSPLRHPCRHAAVFRPEYGPGPASDDPNTLAASRRVNPPGRSTRLEPLAAQDPNATLREYERQGQPERRLTHVSMDRKLGISNG